MEPQEGMRIIFGPYVYDTRADVLLKHGFRIKLQPKPRALLRVLLLHPGELVKREQLREVLWPDGTFVDFDLGLNVAIKKLRDALCDSPDAPIYIETTPGEGYRFVAEVEYEREQQPAPSAPGPVNQDVGDSVLGTAVPAGPAPEPAKRLRGVVAAPRIWAVVGLAAAVLIAVAASRWHRTYLRPIAVHQVTWNTLDTPVDDAAISPSGKLLAIVDGHGLNVQEVASGQLHRLAAPDSGGALQVSWLPDSAGLLVCGKNGIWTVSLLGGSAKVHDALRPPPWSGCAAAMSPDGSRISYVDSDGIWMMGQHGEGARRIVAKQTRDRIGGPTWSPDSSRIAYSLHRQTTDGVNATIETCDVNGGAHTTIALEGGHVGPSHWAWLPDGRIILSRPEPVPYGYFANLWQIRVDQRNGQQLSDPQRLTDFPDFRMTRISGSLDSKILFLRPTNVGTVLAGDISDDGRTVGELREIVKDDARNRPVAWSADGESLFVLSDRGRTSSLVRIHHSGQSPTATPVEVPSIEMAQLVSNDAELVYGIEQPQRYSIFRRAMAGGSTEVVLTTQVELDFRCASRAPTCAIVDKVGDHLRLSAFDVSTGERRDLATMPLTADPGWSLSPDGTRLAVIRLEDSNANKIDILGTATGKRLGSVAPQIDGMLGDLGWAGQDALIVTAISPGGGSDLLRVDLHGNQRALWHDPRFLGTLSVSPDGRHVALSALQAKVNAWLAENF